MTALLAKIFGLYFIGVSIAFIINPKRIKPIYQKMTENEAVLFLGGIFALLIGAVVISVHNVWVMEWPVFITLLGWISFLKGVGLMAFRDFSSWFQFWLGRSENFYRGMGVLMLLVGLLLVYAARAG